ncbi:MAG: hypothetical protein IKE31_02955 [Eubacterium sp.]|nr:hypothetical protein [Eubacterium sp.]
MNDKQQKNRYAELAEKSRRQHIYQYTDFLTPADAADACSVVPEKERAVFGGAQNCERVIVRYGDPADTGFEEPFPIAVIRIRPQHARYAENLTHRDYLGALMHLGIERDILGDILVRETGTYVFTEEHMAEYICRELTQVRHTSVCCEILQDVPEDALPRLEAESVIAASARLDVILAKVYHLSRTRSKELFAAGHVQIGGRVCEKESILPRSGDIVSVRGYGKFRYEGETGTTKKGSLVLEILKYS